MTQKEFAKAVGKSHRTIQGWEQGDSNPSDATISHICAQLNVNKDWLLIGEGTMLKPSSAGFSLKGENIQMINGNVEHNFFNSYQQQVDERLVRLFELIIKYATPTMITEWEKKLLQIKKLHEE